MTIPTPLTTNSKTIHCPKSWNSVFDGTSQNMTVVRGTGRKRWAVIKHVVSFWSTTGWRLYTFIKNIVSGPERLNFFFAQRHLRLGYFGYYFDTVVLSVYFFRHKKLNRENDSVEVVPEVTKSE